MPKAADNVRYCSVSGDVYDAEVISWLWDDRDDPSVTVHIKVSIPGVKDPVEFHAVPFIDRPSHTEVPGFAFPRAPESAPPAEAT